jgi:hypothetical protein
MNENECPIRPATGQCDFDLGLDPATKHRKCPTGATMRFPTLNSVRLCDRHAELAMTSVCGRAVKIVRGK